jgi:hypothetical protein
MNPGMVDLATLTADHFLPLSGQTFRVTPAGSGGVPMVLCKVRPSSRKVPRGFRQPFAVEFKSPQDIVLPQGLFIVEHETLGAMELMMTPILANGGCHYEAVFG